MKACYLKTTLFFCFFAGYHSFALAEDKPQSKDLPSPEEVLRQLDYLYRADSSLAEMVMTVQTPDWTRTMEIKAWSEGLDNTLIRIISPQRDRGISTLKMKDEMWNYFPRINRVMRVPPSMMTGSWMGSDLTNDDLVRDSSYEEDYTYKLSRDGDHLRIELKPKETTVTVWERIEMKLDAKSWLPIEQVFFNERNEAVRKMEFSEIKEFGDRSLPSRFTVTPLTKEGHKTTIEYKSLAFNQKFPEEIFTLRYLREPI